MALWFTTKMTINYLFEKNQTVRVEIYDCDKDQGNADDLIGEFACPVNKILTAYEQKVKGDLRVAKNRSGSQNRGRCILKADSVANSNNRAKMTIRASLWPKKT